jgi:hypothetical protein
MWKRFNIDSISGSLHQSAAEFIGFEFLQGPRMPSFLLHCHFPANRRINDSKGIPSTDTLF